MSAIKESCPRYHFKQTLSPALPACNRLAADSLTCCWRTALNFQS